MDRRAEGSRSEIIQVLEESSRPLKAREITQETDLSSQTVYRRLEGLEDDGVITSEIRSSAGRGRHPSYYELK